MGRDIASLDDVTSNNVGVLKKINEVVLPVKYSDKWYDDTFDLSLIVKLAYFSELPVGAVKAKAIAKELPSTFDTAVQQPPSVADQVPNAVYIELLAVLPAYRHHGLAKKLLQFVIEETKSRFIHKVVLHVHVDNKEGQDFYASQGFTQGSLIEGFYASQDLKSPDAYVYNLDV